MLIPNLISNVDFKCPLQIAISNVGYKCWLQSRLQITITNLDFKYRSRLQTAITNIFVDYKL